MKKKILIDLQCLQTESAHRGIGRYTYNLTINILQQNTEYDIHILLNSALPNVVKVRQQFKAYVPDSYFHVFTPVVPCCAIDPNNWQNIEASEFMYESFIAKINPDLLFIASLFEGLDVNIINSISKSYNIPTIVIGYDLIPLHYKDVYLENKLVRQFYYHKLQHLQNADLVLGISEYVTNDIKEYLNHSDCINISCAVNEYFSKINYSDEDLIAIRSKFSIKSKYIMYTGGIDFRKNIEGLILQFSLLPKEILDDYSLVIVCKISDFDRDRLYVLADSYKVKRNLIITGYVDDEELRQLYSFCSLFVFPSLDEGFGLPILEAMNCGAVVACANNSSLPEVVGFDGALFDVAHDFHQKIYELLTDDLLRQTFLKHSIQQAQKFSWTKTASRALNAFSDALLIKAAPITRKKTLAMVSPFPPQQSGIADYSMELIQYLSAYYNITLVCDEQPSCDNVGYFNLIDYSDFEALYEQFDRVIYQMGNSPFHSKMYRLMNKLPGVLVLHDFFIGHFVNYDFTARSLPLSYLVNRAIDDHGCQILPYLEDYQFLNKFPLNADIIKSSLGVIVHSTYVVNKVVEYYPTIDISKVMHIPLLRKKHHVENRDKVSKGEMFTIVSMGGITQFKCIIEIVQAIAILDKSIRSNLRVIFVGDKGEFNYFNRIEKSVRAHNLQDIIQFTHRVNAKEYFKYLSDSDLAIQLRLNSMGETSASVLDCMNVGIPVIVNSHGSICDLPDDVVYKISENFSAQELADNIIKLMNNPLLRKELSAKSTSYVAEELSPNLIAELYYKGIEEIYSKLSNISILNKLKNFEINPLLSAFTFSQNFNISLQKVIYIDITSLVKIDHNTGIQRVEKIILQELLKFYTNFRIIPVYWANNKFYTAVSYVSKLFNQNINYTLADSPIQFFDDSSIFIGIDLHFDFLLNESSIIFLKQQQVRGTKLYSIQYDLIPIITPYADQDIKKHFHDNMKVLSSFFDGVIAISKSVADEYVEWYLNNIDKRNNKLSVGYFHLGCDIDNYNSHHASDNVEDLSMLNNKKYMLMVSTIEPRKGHAQVLEAFEKLWGNGSDYCLVFVGKQGWNVEELIDKISKHTQLSKKLFWLQGISDQALTKVYEMSSAFIMASFAEGFGLGIVESAKYNKPLILRDIPVFREIAENNAYYFDCLTGYELAVDLNYWIDLYDSGKEPKSDKLKTITWKESCDQLMDVILNNKWYKLLNND